MESIVQFFMPDELLEEESLQTRRAEIVIKMVFLIAIVGIPFSAVYQWGMGATEAAMGVVGGVGVLLAVPILLRKTGSMRLVGHLMLTTIVVALVWITWFTGGLYSPALAWLILLPVLAVVVFSVRLGLAWVGVIMGIWAAVFGLESAGVELGQALYQESSNQLRILELASVGSLVFGLVYLKDNLEVWLRDAIRQKERETSSVVETAPDGILTVDFDGTVAMCNQAASRIFERPERELCGMDIRELIDGLSLADIEDGAGVGHEERFQGHRRETTFPLEVAYGLLGGDDAARGIVLVLRDVTERTERQQQLRDARDRALEASQAKSTFLANMSHELRTPLNAVIGYSEMLLEEVEYIEQSNPEVADLIGGFAPDLNRIHNAGDHLLALINDILDLSKIEAGKMQTHVETFEIRELCKGIAGTVEPLAGNNDNVFEMDIEDDPGEMRTDATKVRQILFNLLSNACKFTSDGVVRLTVRDVDDDEVEFVVQDTGIGMSKEQIEQIFEAFRQADSSTTREFGGTGLGLTITSHFCTLLDGSIEVESEPGEGTTFSVRLARELEEEDESADEEARPGVRSTAQSVTSTAQSMVDADGNAEQVILVVDDDATVRDLLTRMLESEGFEVVTAASGSEGLLLAEKLNPSAITLDVMMPSMDGWTMLSKLKEDPELSDIPVVMVSMLAEENRGYALGADDYLVKPVDKQELVDVLQRFQSVDVADGDILVVEDDEPTRSLMRRVLEQEGWSVVDAEDGVQALKCVEETTPELVFLDLMMPNMDGFEFLQRFRQDEAHRDIPVVVVTAKELTPDDRRQLEADVEDILEKGGRERDELLDDIRKMVVDVGGAGP